MKAILIKVRFSYNESFLYLSGTTINFPKQYNKRMKTNMSIVDVFSEPIQTLICFE